MARDIFVAGEVMVSVKGSSASGISSLTQLGLADNSINIRLNPKHMNVFADAWGSERNGPPFEIQTFLADADITMTLVHFDPAVLDICFRESMGGASAAGTTARAGARLGNGAARFAATNRFIGLNLSGPVSSKPYRFYYTYLIGEQNFPVGTERSIVTLHWKAIPATSDPWGGGTQQGGTTAGTGALGALIWDNTADT